MLSPTLRVMRLELGRRADYAIRATLDLARAAESGGRRKARAIAEEMSIPASYVPQIMAELVRAGIARSVAGPDGGYVLAQPPAQITMLQVLRAVDGEPTSTACVLRGGPCRWEEACAVHEPWMQAQGALLDSLEQTNFADLASRDGSLEALATGHRSPRRNAGAGPVNTTSSPAQPAGSM
jgi:Rrf2 family transcriptional regulator, iron-sulfur cluster assembly transcription factor